MSSDEFWNLSWYNWGLLVLRLIKENKRTSEDREFMMELTGRFMALFASANSKKEFRREDFFKLSYDNQVEERPLTFKEAKELYGSRIRKEGDGK